MRKRRQLSVVLEPRDAALAIARAPVEVLVGHLLLVEARAQDREQARELREDERLVPLVRRLEDLRHQHVELRGSVAAPRRVDEARVAGGLAQAQQRFEDLDLAASEPLLADALEQRAAVVAQELVVERALRPLELAEDRLLGLGRELGRDLVLGAPQDERPQAAREDRELGVVGPRRRRPPAGEPREARSFRAGRG